MAEGRVVCGSFAIPADHPCLPGHFPGNAVVPGVVLLDHALALLQVAFGGRAVQDVRAVRFRQIVRPAQHVAMEGHAGRRDLIDFTGSHEGAVVFSGSIRLAPP